MSIKWGFRCKNCGRLHNAASAGDGLIPHACCVCGKGVSFSTNGIKGYHPENWVVLANCTKEELAEYGINFNDVENHKPNKHISVFANEQLGTRDK